MIYDKAMHEARKYWREHLDSMSFEGHVALDHPRRKDGQPELSSLDQALDPELHALLWRLGAGNPFLSYTAFVLALKICCFKYSGDPRVTLFSPAMRGGSTANVLPISSVLDGSSSFKEALLATKELLSRAYRFQQYPWSRMLLDLPEERRPRPLPMIASMVGFTDELPEAPCDIAIRFEMTEHGTQVTYRFDRRLHEAPVIQSFSRSFSGILRQGLAQMGSRIEDLRPAHGGADGAPPAAGIVDSEGAQLHRLIEAQVAKHRERAAVVHDGRVTTYETLNGHADDLAKTLAALALDVRKPIVLLMDAGAEMIVSMLAVLKLGAAFVPIKLLSTRGPVTRILEAVEAECILCQPGHVAHLRQGGDGLGGVEHLITVEYAAPSSGDTTPPLEITRERISRTTMTQSAAGGVRPGTACVFADEHEGAVSASPVSHAELAHLFQWLNEHSGIGADDRCLLSPGLGACQQLYDTLGMLAAGASVEIADASSLRDTSLLAERLTAPGITVWDLPTPLMQNALADLLALCARRQDLRGPRVILLSGEKQCVRLAERLRWCFPNTRLTGLYANAAVGIWTTFFPLGAGPAEPDPRVIAQAIPGFNQRIVNGRGELAPLHTKGELHLTRALPAPEEVKMGLRAEPLGDGRMSWLRGEQHCFTKYGCRVELTKVEAALCEHEHILAAEVVTLKPELETASLVVAFVIGEQAAVSAEAARDLLVCRDDVDIVPDRFIVLDEFPLAADGAIDRDLLIRRFVTSQEVKDGSQHVQADEVHRQLKRIWLELLELDDVDEGDSFFARGGNSLKATLLLARIRDDFSVDLSVQQFFREPTIRAVAQMIAIEARSATHVQTGADLKLVPRENYRVRLPEVERGAKSAAGRT